MKKDRFFLTVLLSCAAAMVIVICGMTGMADAGSVTIPVAAFTSDGDNAQFDYFKSFAAGTLTGSANGACLVAPVNIPATATTITKLIVYLKDTKVALNNPLFFLTGMKQKDGTTTAYVPSTSVSTGTSTLQGIQVPVQIHAITPGQNIALGLCIYNGHTIYGAKVNYQ